MNFLDTVATDFCRNLGPIVYIVRVVISLFKWGIPVLLVVFGTLDLGKAVIASKEDEMKKAQATLIKRVIYAVAVFLVVTIVQLVMTAIGNSGANVDSDVVTGKDWIKCFFEDSNNNNGAEENS